MTETDIKTLLDGRISRERAKELLIALVKVPSPQTALLEEEPLLKECIKSAIEPRLRTMGFADIRYDAMGNLIAALWQRHQRQVAHVHRKRHEPAEVDHGERLQRRRGRWRKFDLPGECVMGRAPASRRRISRPCCTPWRS
jgi:hypothetical protein